MGLKAILKSAGKTAFKVAGDAKRTFTYTQTVDDGVAEVKETVFSVDAIMGEYSHIVVAQSENILPGDVPATVLVADMQVIPEKGDILTEGDETFRVENFLKDPVGVTYELQLRSM